MAVGFAEEITGHARLRELIKPPSRKVSHKAIVGGRGGHRRLRIAA